jgi:hypothetical protein
VRRHGYKERFAHYSASDRLGNIKSIERFIYNGNRVGLGGTACLSCAAQLDGVALAHMMLLITLM